MYRVNKRFNRSESDCGNQYWTEFGTEQHGKSIFDGYVKCKLIHARWGSAILPDQIFIGNKADKWIQPLSFTACQLANLGDGDLRAFFYVDISCGQTIRVDFEHSGIVTKGRDGSEFYQCKIKGPEDLEDFATGISKWRPGELPTIQLFHHTAEQTKPMIENSGHFRGSPWNIQGNKELTNVSYAYFTCLDQIQTRQDLTQIAMATDGRIHLMTDGFDPPEDLNAETAQGKYSDYVLTLEVYREDTENRTATLKAFVDSDDLSSQHIHFHRPTNSAAYYEVCRPFVYRVGLLPGEILGYDTVTRQVDSNGVKLFSHVVAGDARTIEGLRAPYDEENTTDIFKVERVPEGRSLLSFWFEDSNRDHFSTKQIEAFDFKATTSDNQ